MANDKFLTKENVKESLFAAVFALLVWGGWAYWINSLRGDSEQALRSGITQGVYSAAMTFYLSYAVFFLWKKTRHLKLWWLLPALGTVGHTGILLVLAHFFNHTPDIVKTVSAPLSVALLYCIFLTRNFQKKSDQKRL